MRMTVLYMDKVTRALVMETMDELWAMPRTVSWWKLDFLSDNFDLVDPTVTRMVIKRAIHHVGGKRLRVERHWTRKMPIANNRSWLSYGMGIGLTDRMPYIWRVRPLGQRTIGRHIDPLDSLRFRFGALVVF